MPGGRWCAHGFVCKSGVCGGRLDKAVPFQQERAGGFKIELPLDGNEGKQRMQRERHYARQQASSDPYCEAQVFEITDALLVWVFCENCHFRLPQLARIANCVVCHEPWDTEC